uniref:Uncharacterized protein n=1 Tax=Arundo donax TaxID=35708 RepID=A0A0A9HB64_ARUDO
MLALFGSDKTNTNKFFTFIGKDAPLMVDSSCHICTFLVPLLNLVCKFLLAASNKKSNTVIKFNFRQSRKKKHLMSFSQKGQLRSHVKTYPSISHSCTFIYNQIKENP